MTDVAVLLVQAAVTLPLVGLIWTVQLVHYPLFDGVGAEGFAEYERRHSLRITWIVAPLMLAELAVSGWLAVQPPAGVPAWQCWLGATLTAGIWLSTGFLQVPRHRELAAGFVPAAHAALVGTNWLRTLLWSGRGALALAMLAARLS
ncbi:hypothetical protein [Alienimonas californiensis]|uniref:DUF1772 domain-containing protein n=1 Tax=Alienimonas californiensis TaxID=2527989 RepID=A0A517P7K1_9PLAN|nr:hypothetical protein [Alienimonas californiensis]QDT15361.1 hypothetical protein CA12_14460 [Alienimonas californiensis]